MMDNAGAVVGPLLAFVMQRVFGLSIRTVFALAIVPGLVALGTLVFGVQEPRAIPEADGASPKADPAATPIPASLRAYLGVVAVFTLGASADSFLLLRIGDLGLSAAWVPLVWLTLNAAKAMTNVPGGRLADRIGRKRALLFGWCIYGAAYAAFPLTQSIALTWALVVAYGTYYGLAEGAEKALVADLAPKEARGRAFGLFHAITGVVVLPANAVFGALYGRGAVGTAFAVGAVAALSAALGLAVLVKPSADRAS
jgi:MFS family permease